MILPVVGFLPFLLISVAAGILVLFLHPRWKVDLVNLVFFVAGSLLAAVAAGMVFALLFEGNKAEPVQSGTAGIIRISLLILSLLAGGYAGVSAWQRIMHRKMNP